MADSCADSDEDFQPNGDENFLDNVPGKSQVKQINVNPKDWDYECAVLRVVSCLLILCIILFQTYVDYKAFRMLEFSEDDYDELLPLGSSCSPDTIFVWPSKGHGDLWTWEPADRTLKVNTTLFIR
ncbi:uncharacterized protein LOC133191262 [Saccostrea echinata]|uniref:uncharacterized protein LOC133191262 n=1 Tax=Saccostrea echinata TaxID=191078 RepID=UPI002A7F7451|nr:uncharacterized protein LOC133191262 [Saccostrea echinata]